MDISKNLSNRQVPKGIPGAWKCRKHSEYDTCEYKGMARYTCTILGKDKYCIDKEVEKMMEDERKIKEEEINKKRRETVKAQVVMINDAIGKLHSIEMDCFDGDTVEHIANAVARSIKAKNSLMIYADKYLGGLEIE